MTTKTYRNDEITVVWKPDLCIHSEKCFHGLGVVFDPNRRPWVDLSAAPSDAIAAQVGKCPSGALSLGEREAKAPLAAASGASVELLPNGPLLIRGSHTFKGADGQVSEKSGVVAYCRCGSSGKKPFCDGSHARVGFKG